MTSAHRAATSRCRSEVYPKRSVVAGVGVRPFLNVDNDVFAACGQIAAGEQVVQAPATVAVEAVVSMIPPGVCPAALMVMPEEVSESEIQQVL